MVDAGAPENALQKLISKGPWLIDPTWSVITMNQSLRTFAERFTALWRSRYGEDLAIDIGQGRTRPDFTAMEVSGRLRVIEIKAPRHKLDSNDFGRLQNYVLALRKFFAENRAMSETFRDGWQLDLVVDGVAIKNSTELEALSSFQEKEEVVQVTWEDFIARAQRANSEFLNVRYAANRESEQLQESLLGSEHEL